MGNCLGGGGNKTGGSTTVSKTTNQTEYKFLLLGSGESGKSTFHKQLRIVFGDSFIEKEDTIYKAAIYSNVLHTMGVLCEYCEKKGLHFEDSSNNVKKFFFKTFNRKKQKPLLNYTTKKVEVET
jgi:hypothetical protein